MQTKCLMCNVLPSFGAAFFVYLFDLVWNVIKKC